MSQLSHSMSVRKDIILDPIAAERWNVESKRAEIDAKIEAFYNAQISKCINIENISNKKAMKLYNDIFYKVKWSSPAIPSVHSRLIVAYCGHLLNVGSKIAFPNELDLTVWLKKSKGTALEKTTMEIVGMYKRMFQIIDKRDNEIIKAQTVLSNTTDKLNIKKDGTLRYMMERNHNTRDNYFTIWYLASNNKTRELEVFLNSATKLATLQHGIDTPDPDFGLTALHYAIKHNHVRVFQLLLKYKANVLIRGPDGRTALHYAAAYSTKEVVLELLAMGIEYDTKDNYNCTAYDLAHQNHNTKTIEVLANWNTLVPQLSALEMQQLQIELCNDESLFEGSKSTVQLNKHLTNSIAAGSGAFGETFYFNANAPDQRDINKVNKMNQAIKDSTAGNHNDSFSHTDSNEPSPNNLPINSTDNNNISINHINSSSSVFVHIPEEYTVTAEDTIRKMSPVLRLLTKRLDSSNKYTAALDALNRSDVYGTALFKRRDESARYFMSRSVASVEYVAASLTGTPMLPPLSLTQALSQSQVLPHPGQQSHQEQSEQPSQEKQVQVANKTLRIIAESPIVLSEPQLVTKHSEVERDKIIPVDLQSIDESIQFGEEIPTFGTDSHHVPHGTIDYDSILQQIESEVNDCQVEIRQCSKHYALCTDEGFLTEALRSLKRRWLVVKELLVLYDKRCELVTAQWEDRNHVIIHNNNNIGGCAGGGGVYGDYVDDTVTDGDGLGVPVNVAYDDNISGILNAVDDMASVALYGDNAEPPSCADDAGSSGGPGLTSPVVQNRPLVPPIALGNQQTQHTRDMPAQAQQPQSQRYTVETDEEESVRNIAANAAAATVNERIDLNRLALNYHNSLKRIVFLPTTEVLSFATVADSTAAHYDRHRELESCRQDHNQAGTGISEGNELLMNSVVDLDGEKSNLLDSSSELLPGGQMLMPPPAAATSQLTAKGSVTSQPELQDIGAVSSVSKISYIDNNTDKNLPQVRTVAGDRINNNIYSDSSILRDHTLPLTSYTPDTTTSRNDHHHHATTTVSDKVKQAVTENLTKDVLRFGGNINIYYEAAQYVDAVKSSARITALDIIRSINEQSKTRRINYQRDVPSTAASATITQISDKYSIDDSLSISTRDSRPNSIITLTTTHSMHQDTLENTLLNANSGRTSRISITHCIILGLELVDVLLARQEEGFAIRVLEECCLYVTRPEIDLTLKVKLLDKKGDLLLLMYRYLSSEAHLHCSSAVRDRECKRADEMWLGVQYVATLGIVNSTAVDNNHCCSSALAQPYNQSQSGLLQLQNSHSEHSVTQPVAEVLILSGSGGEDEDNDDCGGHVMFIDTSNNDNDSHTSKDMLSGDQQLNLPERVQQQQQQQHNYEHSINLHDFNTAQTGTIDLENSIDDAALHDHQQQVVEFTTPEQHQNRQAQHQQQQQQEQKMQPPLDFTQQCQQYEQQPQYQQLTPLDHRTQVLDSILLNLEQSAELSLDVHAVLYRDDLLEPYTLSKALQSIAYSKEYSGDGLEALIYMQHAELVAARALGVSVEESIQVALEALRLFVSYHLRDRFDLQYVSAKSTEINSNIKEFANNSSGGLMTHYSDASLPGYGGMGWSGMQGIQGMSQILRSQTSLNRSYVNGDYNPTATLNTTTVAGSNGAKTVIDALAQADKFTKVSTELLALATVTLLDSEPKSKLTSFGTSNTTKRKKYATLREKLK